MAPPFYPRVPKDPIENLEWRRYIIEAADTSPRLQAALFEACRIDPCFYFNAFVWTYDPRLPNGEKIVPFNTYFIQDEAILDIWEAVRDQKQLLLQKSRDMGASWIALGVMDHQAIFERENRFVLMSNVAANVDDQSNPKSLMWKVDFIHEHLPRWLRPKVNRKLMTIEYVKSGSTVSGVATTGYAAVGDRATAIFVDEFSRFDPKEAMMVMAGIADTARCRIWNFTPFGMAHPSYDLVRQAQKGTLRCHRMHWLEHPEKAKGHYTYDIKTNELKIIDKKYQFPKNYEFQKDGKFFNHSVAFDRERIERGDDRVMCEMWEIDYQGTSTNFFDQIAVRDWSLEFARDPDVEGDLNFDIRSGHPREFMRIKNGPIKLWMDLDRWGRPLDGFFAAGCDIATGQGASNSCICIVNCATGVKVLEYATPNMLPEDFAVKCVAICRWLAGNRRDLRLAWECPGPGIGFGKKVMELGYSPVYWRQNEMSLSREMTDTPGFYSNKTTKRLLLEEYRESLSRRDYINRSRDAYAEMAEWEFVLGEIKHKGDRRKSIDPTGASINHGDRTIADALADKMRKESGVERAEGKEKVMVGSLQWHMDNETATGLHATELYPDWNRRRR